MHKTILVALAATAFTLAGCADDTAETTDMPIETAPVETMPAEDMMMDTTMADPMMDTTMADPMAAPADTTM